MKKGTVMKLSRRKMLILAGTLLAAQAVYAESADDAFYDGVEYQQQQDWIAQDAARQQAELQRQQVEYTHDVAQQQLEWRLQNLERQQLSGPH
jgi:hypothetical protein